MKRVMLLVGAGAVLGCIAAALAGWQHNPTQQNTAWVERPTPATCWVRDYKRDCLWPAQKVFVYADTPRYFNYAHANATNDLACTGYWEQDRNGDYWPRSDLGSVVVAGQYFQVNALWVDVEWEIGSDGIMWPKD